MVKITSDSKLWRIIYLALLSLSGVLALFLIIGTIYGLARYRDAEPLFTLGGPAETRTGETAALPGDTRVFSWFGRLRIPLANSSILILSIAFPYSANDAAFAEELAAKTGDFRAIAADYFSALPAESVIQFDEDKVKQELLELLNENLRLGRIQQLYFSDFMIID